METDTVPSFGSPAEIPVRKTPISCAVRAIITIIFQEMSCIQIQRLQRSGCMVSLGSVGWGVQPNPGKWGHQPCWTNVWSFPALHNNTNSDHVLTLSMCQFLAKCCKYFNSNPRCGLWGRYSLFSFSLLSAVAYKEIFLTNIRFFFLWVNFSCS